ncbi:hypothetical protein MSSD14B_38800 [Marinobacter salsuginis]|jgi:hypothetical protein|uniref:Uncharacterized protein n=1 Tax=Marinobacter salsuginis TaxID=418719 RepID=A0A5M3Q4R8_9GAMM|nr:hypothetical protein MSSD14B_38800 [Marinobacter salsuginis]
MDSKPVKLVLLGATVLLAALISYLAASGSPWAKTLGAGGLIVLWGWFITVGWIQSGPAVGRFYAWLRGSNEKS